MLPFVPFLCLAPCTFIVSKAKHPLILKYCTTSSICVINIAKPIGKVFSAERVQWDIRNQLDTNMNRKDTLLHTSKSELSRRRFLRGSAATAMGVVASAGQNRAADKEGGSNSLSVKKHSKELREKAEKVELFLIKNFLDSNNIVFTHLDKKTLKPPVESFFPEIDSKMSIMDYHIEGYTRSGIAAYENCGMTTGAYMQSLLYQYKVEKNPAILQKVRKCYSGIKYIYEIGKELEEGFFPKIYGNKFSRQTSSDQVLYVVSALDHFSEYADREEQNEIGNMIYQLVNFG